MRLAKAASFFNDTVCQDAYTGATLFTGQFPPYDDSKRDAEVNERRTLSVAPNIVIPARRAVRAMDRVWLLGHASPDYFKGRAIRMGYVAHEATEQAQIRTLAEVCLDQPGLTAWSAIFTVKRLAFIDQSSDLPRQVHIFLSTSESVQVNRVIRFGTQLFLVRSLDVGPSGVQSLLCDEMPEPVIETVNVTTGNYDPLLDKVVGTPQAVRVVRLRWQSIFAYLSDIGPSFAPGDVQFAVAKASLTAKVGATVAFSTGTYKVAWVRELGDVWLCRGVRHA